MTPFLRFARAGALAPLLCCGALTAWSQAPEGNADTVQPPAGVGPLPGTVVERNVFVPVDSTGHTGGEYIVVERRVVTKDGASGSTGGEAPTHFILVPQEAGDDEVAPEDSDSDGGETAPR